MRMARGIILENSKASLTWYNSGYIVHLTPDFYLMTLGFEEYYHPDMQEISVQYFFSWMIQNLDLCVWVCVSAHACTWVYRYFRRDRRECQIPWSLSYRLLWATKPGCSELYTSSLEEQQELNHSLISLAPNLQSNF